MLPHVASFLVHKTEMKDKGKKLHSVYPSKSALSTECIEQRWYKYTVGIYCVGSKVCIIYSFVYLLV